MILERVPQVSEMTLAEKAQLFDELWFDLQEHFNRLPARDSLIAEMDREMEAYRQDASRGSTWEEVRQRLQTRSRDRA